MLVRVLIVAEDPYVRVGLKAMLELEDEFDLCGQISLDEFRNLSPEIYSPDVILLDAHDSQGLDDGLKADILASEWPILLLGLDPELHFHRWPSNLSRLHPRANKRQLRAAVLALAAGLQVWNRDLEREIPPDVLPKPIMIEPSLTDREMEVLHKLAEGLTNRAIAHGLGISENTVKFHVNGILQKLQAQSRTEAVVQAMRAGLLPL